jgi:hypothetical protein
VVFFQIAHGAKNVSIRFATNVQRWKYFLAAYYAVFGTAIVVFLITDNMNFMQYMAAVPVLIIIYTFYLGSKRMEETLRAPEIIQSTQNAMAVMFGFIHRVKRAMFVFGMLGIFFLVGISVAWSLESRFVSIGWLLVMCMYFCFAAVLLAATEFMRFRSKNLIARVQGESKAMALASGNGHTSRS